MHDWLTRTRAILSSDRFFYAVVIIFALQALWFALSAVYPMAFDENFHFGLIKIYAQQWSPFLTEAPLHSGEFGPLTRDNSYLFHYLMSFPYRLIAFFVSHEEGQIVFLRLLNISFFAGGILLFRRLLLKTPASRALIHFALLMFVLIPVVPMLAAHINYDNLIFLLTPVILLLTLHCGEALRRDHAFPLIPLAMLVSLSFLTSIVKYAFLPVFLGAALYLLIILIRQPSNKRFLFLKKAKGDYRHLPLKMRIVVILAVAISGGFFLERYAVNVVQYQAIVPECSKVVSVEHCLGYGPWARNYAMKADLYTPPATHFGAFNIDWFNGMLFRLFFAINFDYDTQPPVLLPIAGAYIVAIPGLIITGVYLRRLIRRSTVLLLFLLVILIYGASIYATNLKSYLALGELTAVNGRYFIPLLPLICIIIGLAFREFVRRFTTSAQIKTAGVIILTILFLQGGGVTTFLIRSDTNWYWQSQPIITINEWAKAAANTFIIFK